MSDDSMRRTGFGLASIAIAAYVTWSLSVFANEPMQDTAIEQNKIRSEATAATVHEMQISGARIDAKLEGILKALQAQTEATADLAREVRNR